MKELNCVSGDALSPDLLVYCARYYRLTPVETEIVFAVAQGISASHMATLRSVSAKTTSTQKRNAYRKMNINSDVEFIHLLYLMKEKYCEGTLDDIIHSKRLWVKNVHQHA